MARDTSSTLVYSSETGIVRTAEKTVKKQNQKVVQTLPDDGIVRLRRETKGRGGGTVIVVAGVPGTPAELKELAGVLKKRCGCGGTIREASIEIQGDHRDTILQELQTRGYRVKLAGG